MVTVFEVCWVSVSSVVRSLYVSIITLEKSLKSQRDQSKNLFSIITRCSLSNLCHTNKPFLLIKNIHVKHCGKVRLTFVSPFIFLQHSVVVDVYLKNIGYGSLTIVILANKFTAIKTTLLMHLLINVFK